MAAAPPPLPAWRAGAMALLTALCGFGMAVQVCSNNRASAHFGLPFAGGLVTFATGAALLAALTALENARGASAPGSRWLGWRAAPSAANLSPGLFGCAYVVGSIVLSGVIGVNSFWLAAILGQLCAAQALDHFGLSAEARKPFTPAKAVLLLVAAAGVALSVASRLQSEAAGIAPLVGCLLASALVGAGMPVQQAFTRGAVALLPSRLAAAFYTFIVGLGAAGVAFGAQAGAEPAAAAQLGARLASSSWFMYLGGVLGVLYICSAIFFTPQIGAAAYFVSLVSGQLVGSAAVDATGLFGSPQRNIDALRVAGIATMLMAAAALAAGPDALAARAWAACCGGGEGGGGNGGGDGGGDGGGNGDGGSKLSGRAEGVSLLEVAEKEGGM